MKKLRTNKLSLSTETLLQLGDAIHGGFVTTTTASRPECTNYISCFPRNTVC